MLKTYDLGLNVIEDEMIKRENVYLNDKERMAYWKARNNTENIEPRDEFEYKFFDMLDEFVHNSGENKITDEEFVHLIQAVVDKRHNMKKICPDLHEEPASPIVKHEPVELTPATVAFLKKNSSTCDAQSIKRILTSGLEDEEQWDLLTAIFDNCFKFDDCPRFYLHILADDDRGYMLNPRYSEGSMWLMPKDLKDLFTQSEIEELRIKLPHISLDDCVERAEKIL